MMSGSSNKILSIESNHSSPPASLVNWLLPEVSHAERECVLCVPRVLSLTLSWLERNWSAVDSGELNDDGSGVISTLEYFRVNGSLPENMDHMVTYVLENLEEAIIPTSHYDSFLISMLFYKKEIQIKTVESLLRDANLLSEVILDRVVTTLSQLIMVYPPDRATVARDAICHIMAPAMMHSPVEHTMMEGEIQAREEVIRLILSQPTDALRGVRREIAIIDKKMRIKNVCEMIDLTVDSSDIQNMSSHLLKRLWNQSIGLYYRSKGEEEPLFSPISPYWKMIGFQRETPMTDFRGGGLLSLMHLVRFVERYPEFILQLINDPNELKLPLAIACINLSIMLVRHLGLYNIGPSADVLLLANLPVWPIASEPSFLDSLFISVASTTFCLFTSDKAFFLQFTPLLQEMSVAVQHALQSGVSSIANFHSVLQMETESLHIIKTKPVDSYYSLLRREDRLFVVAEGVCAIGDNTNSNDQENDEETMSLWRDGIVANAIAISDDVIAAVKSDFAPSTSSTFRCLFRSSSVNGLQQMLDVGRGVENTVLLICDTGYNVFGCYDSEAWKYSSSFYGSENCKVFKCVKNCINGGKGSNVWNVVSFKSCHVNTFYRLSTESKLVVGGGTRHALLLDSSLYHGSSGPCPTFKSLCLSENSDFECIGVELWAFSS